MLPHQFLSFEFNNLTLFLTIHLAIDKRMKDLESVTAELIHANEIAERRLNMVEKVGSFLIVYLTIATAGILGLLIYAIL